MAIPIGFYAGLRDPFIQTFIARSAAAYLSSQFGAEVRIGAFYIDLDLSLKLEDVYVGDQRGNTLLRAQSLKMRPLSYEFRKGFSVRELSMSDFEFQLIKYKDEEALNLQFIIDYFSGADKPVIEQTDVSQYPFHLRSFRLKEASFRYWDQNKDNPGQPGMDYAHINLTDIDLKISNLYLVGDSIASSIEKLTANDASGLQLNSLSGQVLLSSKGLDFGDFQAQINNSSLNFELGLRYNSYAAFLDFIDSVELQVKAHPSVLQMADIGYFAPVMFDMQNVINFAGDFTGPVNNLLAKGLSFSYGRSTVFAGDVQLTGLPDIYETFGDINIRRFETEVDDLQRFALAGNLRYLPLPNEIVRLGNIKMNGQYSGFYNDFYAKMDVTTQIGTIKTNLEMRQSKETGLFHYAGRLETLNFDVAKLLNSSETLGMLEMNVLVNGKGLSVETADMNLAGTITKITLIDNQFRDIELSGDLTGKAFNGRVSIDDPKLKLEFLGRANFANTLPAFDFGAIITHADLYSLNLMDQDSIMQLSAEINVNFVGMEPDNLVGNIDIEHAIYKDSRGEYQMDEFRLMTTHHGLYPRRLTITSDFFDLDIGGEIDFANFGESFKRFTANYLQFRNFEPTQDSIFLQDFFIDVQLKNTETLSRLFMPAVSISDNSRFSGVFTNRDRVLNTTFRSAQFAFGTTKINNLILKTQSDLWQASAQLIGDDIIFRDSVPGNPTILGINQPDFLATFANDSISFRLQWVDEHPIARNRGDVMGYYAALVDEPHELRITSADLVVNDSVWRISRGNSIVFAEEYTMLHDFHIRQRNQSISLQGKVPLNEADSLQIRFDNWDLSNFDLLMQGSGLDFDGAISGELMLANLRQQPAFVSNLQLQNLHMNSERLGDARILSTWSDLEESLYLNVQIINVGNITTSRMLNLRGFYYPNRPKIAWIFPWDLKTSGCVSLHLSPKGC
jgi:hypothetical protein